MFLLESDFPSVINFSSPQWPFMGGNPAGSANVLISLFLKASFTECNLLCDFFFSYQDEDMISMFCLLSVMLSHPSGLYSYTLYFPPAAQSLSFGFSASYLHVCELFHLSWDWLNFLNLSFSAFHQVRNTSSHYLWILPLAMASCQGSKSSHSITSFILSPVFQSSSSFFREKWGGVETLSRYFTEN